MRVREVKMKNKHYMLEDESYWYSNGCDCCEPELMVGYNFLDEVMLNHSGTQGGEEDIAREILIYNKHLSDGYDEDESTWKYWDNFDYIAFAKALGYTWEIINGIDTEDTYGII